MEDRSGWIPKHRKTDGGVMLKKSRNNMNEKVSNDGKSTGTEKVDNDNSMRGPQIAKIPN